MEAVTRLFAGISLMLIAVAAICLNLLLLTVLIKGHKEFKNFSFFILTWQLLICDLIALSAQVFLAAPTTIAGYDIYPEFLMLSLAIFDRFSYNGTLLFALILTINRFLVFIQPRINKFLFSSPRIYFLIATAWALLFAFIIGVSVGGCWTTFLADDGFHFGLKCIPKNLRPWYSVAILGPINNYGSFYIPWAMFGLYFITFLEIKFHLTYRLFKGQGDAIIFNTQKKKHTELRLFIQSVVICSVLILEYYAFDYLPRLSEAWPWFKNLDTMLLSWIMVMMNSIHAIVVFTFTKKARSLVPSIFGHKTTHPSFTIFPIRNGYHS